MRSVSIWAESDLNRFPGLLKFKLGVTQKIKKTPNRIQLEPKFETIQTLGDLPFFLVGAGYLRLL
jgi:hypothetical protein